MALRLLLVLCAALLALPVGAAERVKLVVWGLASGEETKGADAAVAEFERRHPHIHVQRLSLGAGGMNPQKLMTSIAGGVPPDVINQDRFTIGDWASRDTFEPLDRLIAADRGPDAIREGDYYPATWAEATYKGRVYAVPYGTDDRALYWNKKLFREAGLDPEKPPRTWEELESLAKRLTKRSSNGSYKSIGFIPNYGNSWLYLYSWQNGGEFMSPDGRTATLHNPQTEEALAWMVRVYDMLGGADAIAAFSSAFQPNELDPFLNDQVAMKIDGNWFLNNLARFGPQVEFGVAPAPVPAARLRGEGRFKGQPPYITWAGGFSFAIPRGSRRMTEAWAFIKWMTSLEGRRVEHAAQQAYNRSKGRPYVPAMSANRRVNEAIFREFAPKDPKYREPLRVFLDLLPVAKFRPVTFVGQRLWDEHVRAFEQSINHKKEPGPALAEGQAKVQAELDKVYRRETYPPLAPAVARSIVALAVALLLGGIAWLAWRIRRMGPLLRGEAVSGYLFASPWIVGFLVFTLGPIVASFIFSFCDYDVLHAPRAVGGANYAGLLGLSNLKVSFGEGIGTIRHWWQVFEVTRFVHLTADAADPLVWKSIANVLYLSVIGIPLSMAISLGLAMLLNTRVAGMPLYRTAYYLPSITPVVAAAMLWPWILNPELGILNAGWRATLGAWFDWPAPTWLASETWSKPSLILLGLWGAGGGMILWLAGLQGVPQALYEAAELDGAGAWARFRHVTLPQLTPYIFFNLLMGTISSLQRFTDIYVMTARAAGATPGGPVDSTLVPVLYLFTNAFQYFKMGYASAWAWILFAVILVLALLQLHGSRRWVHYEGGAPRA